MSTAGLPVSLGATLGACLVSFAVLLALYLRDVALSGKTYATLPEVAPVAPILLEA